MNDAEGFFKTYLAAPVVIASWIGGYFWKHEGWQRTSQIDVDAGRRDIDWEEIGELKRRVQEGNALSRGFNWLC